MNFCEKIKVGVLKVQKFMGATGEQGNFPFVLMGT